MSNKTRKASTAEEKVSILRRHLLEHVPVSDLCDEYHLHPTQFYRWQRQFFENGPPPWPAPYVRLRPPWSARLPPWRRSWCASTRCSPKSWRSTCA
jgi:transposase-like protein